MKKQIVLYLLNALLICLFLYAGVSKIIDHQAFTSAMNNQPIPIWSRLLITKTLPSVEIFIAFTIIFERTQTAGIYAFLLLMTLFSIYILLGMLGMFAYTPCSCGGVISSLSWSQHLIFNLFFIAAAIYALRIRRSYPIQ